MTVWSPLTVGYMYMYFNISAVAIKCSCLQHAVCARHVVAMLELVVVNSTATAKYMSNVMQTCFVRRSFHDVFVLYNKALH